MEVDLHVIMEGGDVPGGVPGQRELLGLVEGTLRSDDHALSRARDAVVSTLGIAALVDAAAVIGNFQRMTRIADGTGIPLDEFMAALTADLRRDLGLDSLRAAAPSDGRLP